MEKRIERGKHWIIGLTVLAFCCMFNVGVLKAEEQRTEDLIYEVQDDNTIMIMDCIENGKDKVNIPETIDGKKVTSLWGEFADGGSKKKSNCDSKNSN